MGCPWTRHAGRGDDQQRAVPQDVPEVRLHRRQARRKGLCRAALVSAASRARSQEQSRLTIGSACIRSWMLSIFLSLKEPPLNASSQKIATCTAFAASQEWRGKR